MGAAIAAHIGHAARIKTGVESSTDLGLFLTLTLNCDHGAVVDPTIHSTAAAMRRTRG